jgi:CRP-like cAMP-binding protein
MAITLQSIPLFRELQKSEQETIARLLTDQTYHAGGTIYTTGEPSENLYIIAKGDVVITNELGKDIITLAELSVGYFFGERGLITEKQVHHAQARAKTDETTILKLSKNNYEKLKKDNPELGLMILSRIAAVLSERLTEDTTRIAIISAISDLVNDPENLNDIKALAQEILQITLRAIPARQAFLGVYKRHAPEQLEIIASIGLSPKHLPQTLPTDSDPYLHKFQTEEGELVMNSDEYKTQAKVFYAKRNLLGRAITVEGENIGTIMLADKESSEFSNQNKLLLRIIAGQISFALEEARLRTQRNAQEELKREYVGI